MKIKHVLASKKDSKPTINDTDMRRLIGMASLSNVILVYDDSLGIFNEKRQISYHLSRNGKTWYADSASLPTNQMPKIGQPIMHNVELFNDGMDLTNEFDLIRKWAKERGIYEKGDTKTQYLKLIEETGELSRAILKSDRAEFIDAIGDCVVVLTNLAELGGVKIEDCINSAYDVIAKRSGVMINGTFVKNSN